MAEELQHINGIAPSLFPKEESRTLQQNSSARVQKSLQSGNDITVFETPFPLNEHAREFPLLQLYTYLFSALGLNDIHFNLVLVSLVKGYRSEQQIKSFKNSKLQVGDSVFFEVSGKKS